jgi:hypothetical protein
MLQSFLVKCGAYERLRVADFLDDRLAEDCIIKIIKRIAVRKPDHLQLSYDAVVLQHEMHWDAKKCNSMFHAII